ncbi:hypothetical protein HOY80DRAFT_957811 [Tuber brumale]|nr:hypothetical protein HOY80DRAFT_957811 [Tuber brumale]
MVKILLGRHDISPGEPNKCGSTPLLLAAYRGHETVVKILLARDDVNPNKPNNYGQTPLDWATKQGHAGVVALLEHTRLPLPAQPHAEQIYSPCRLRISCGQLSAFLPPQPHKHSRRYHCHTSSHSRPTCYLAILRRRPAVITVPTFHPQKTRHRSSTQFVSFGRENHMPWEMRASSIPPPKSLYKVFLCS